MRTTFGLVHGAFHGAWCWEPLAAELAKLGHQSVTMDLPCDDPAAGNVRYADVIIEALDGQPDVVLVGHSLGGLAIPLVADRRDVRRLIFLCAFVPQPGRSFSAWMGEESDIFPPSDADIWPISDDDGLMSWPPDRAVRALYSDCRPDVAQWAASMLRRQSLTPHGEVCPLQDWPDVPSTVIYGNDDLAISVAWEQRTARERLAADAVALPGGHSPFLARPGALARTLVEQAR